MKRLLVAALCAVSTVASGATTPKKETPIIIGVVAFNDTADKDAIYPLLAKFFREVSKPSGNLTLDVHVVRGSYYQIYHWLRDGTIDGAVLSPFMAWAAWKETPKRNFTQIASFPTPTGGHDGNEPVFRALRGKQESNTPAEDLERCARGINKNCHYRFVTHLSTSGFIYPSIRIAELAGRRQAPVDSSEFIMWHKDMPTPPESEVTFEFSYRSKKPQWQALFPPGRRFDDDVLILARDGALAAIWPEIERRFAEARAVKHEAAKGTEYQEAAPPQGWFRERDAAHGALKEQWDEWYRDEKFAFSLKELVDLLMNDQKLAQRENAAIVLPGGGVRGAYQAVILDELYEKLVCNGVKCDGSKHMLQINSIVGTSGGAVMGYFASRLAPKEHTLTPRWVDKNGNVQVRVADVFPPYAVLRWVTVVVAVAIYAFIVGAFLPPIVRRQRGVPRWFTASVGAIALVAPLLIWAQTRSSVQYKPALEEGLYYAALIIFLHFFHTTIRRRGKHQKNVPLMVISLILLALGLGLAIHVAMKPVWIADKVVTASWRVAVAMLTATMAMILLARSHDVRVNHQQARHYLIGGLVVVAYLVVATAIFLAFEALHLTSTLELTREYWEAVIAACVIAATLTAVLARRGPQIIRNAVGFWFAPYSGMPFPYNAMGTFMVASVVALAAWLIFVSPALYNGQFAANTFGREAANLTGQRARLIVPITALGTEAKFPDKVKPINAGDYYACLCPETNAPEACRNDKVIAFKNDHTFIDAVTASGSPFPIFPAEYVQNGDVGGLFVDGGYAHLIPIAAATLFDAKQVLIVGNTGPPAAAKRPRLRMSLLFRGLGKTFDYLFDRSQLSDQAAQRDVIVAKFSPSWTSDDPFLMDFRPATITALVKDGRNDASGARNGRIDSWGTPRMISEW